MKPIYTPIDGSSNYFEKPVDSEFFLCKPKKYVKPPSICAEVAAIGRPYAYWTAPWEEWTGSPTNQIRLALLMYGSITVFAQK